MRHYLLLVAGCLLLAAALALSMPTVGARAGAAPGTISGVVVNATHDNAVVAHQKVTLQRGSGNATQDIATTTTGPDGHFSFANIAGRSSDTYAVYTQFQGGMFPSAAVHLGSAGATVLQLKVYDTTNDDAHLRVSVATLLVRQPRPVNGLVGVGEVITVENTGTTAFVGTPTGDANKPMRLLRFATPPNASNLSLGIGFSGSQIITTDKGFGATATVPPGTSDFAFAIDIPYTGTAADISYKAVYPTARVVMLVPPDMFVNGKDFQAQGLIDSLGTRYQLFTVATATAGRQVSLQVTGLPKAGEQSNLDARALAIFAAMLALLALLALGVYVRRGGFAPALGLSPASSRADDLPATSQAVGATDAEVEERNRLLSELLIAERAHSAGTLSDAAYRQRDRELRRRLRDLLASTPVGDPAAAHSAGTGAPESAGTDSHVEDDVASHEVAPEQQSSGGRR
ncbi:MAG: hypothetical protein ACM3N4_04245 [Nitrososphaerota archaeon]